MHCEVPRVLKSCSKCGKSPIAGTKYTLDDTRVSIRIPHTDYFYKNIFVE